jgi:hypothetical protein
MMRRIPDGLIAKLVFMSGVVWMLFGAVLLIAFMAGFFGRTTTSFPGLIPPFGFVDFHINFSVSWLQMIGLFLAPIFCIVVGFALCVYGMTGSQAQRFRSSD